jgi:hypothetical protein
MSTTARTGTHLTALPDFYYFCFGGYEPFLTFVGLLGTFSDPVSTHNSQAPWPKDSKIAPFTPTTFPRATLVSVIQLAHVCALLGLINLFVLTTTRKYLHSQPALQEKILWALFTPLLLGDVAHIAVTLWALGPDRWNVASWTPMVWATVVLGLSIMIPRICWHLGIARYVDTRDGAFEKSPTVEVKKQ